MRRFSQISFNRRPSQPEPTTHDPVLTAEDEAYFQKVIAQLDTGDPAPLPNDQTLTTSPVGEEARNTPLPPSPVEPGEELKEDKEPEKVVSEIPTEEAAGKKKRRPWSRLMRMGSKIHKDNPRRRPSNDENGNGSPENNQAEDLSDILERLNLSADNNHVFSISDETQELLRKFKLVFKDLVNGVPTAYHDLEMLLNNGNQQLQQTYTKLPGFIQKLIEKLPARFTEHFAPEVLAAASEKAGRSGVNMENVGKATTAAGKMGLEIPSLKELVGKPAALVGMLRSIMGFLKTRFPAVIGMNVLWSLALFILLFVLWYCHKRGREVRLENERLVTEEEMGKINDESGEGKIRPTETLITTAPEGASVEEVREGVKQAQQQHETTTDEERTKENRGGVISPPARSKSKLGLWTRSNQKSTSTSTSRIEPYPGT